MTLAIFYQVCIPGSSNIPMISMMTSCIESGGCKWEGLCCGGGGPPHPREYPNFGCQYQLWPRLFMKPQLILYYVFSNRRWGPRMEWPTFSRQILRRSPTYHQRISPGFPSGASCGPILNRGPCGLGLSVRPTRTALTIKSLPWQNCRGGRAFHGAWPLSDSKWPSRGNDTYVKSSSSGLHKNSGKVEKAGFTGQTLLASSILVTLGYKFKIGARLATFLAQCE